MAWYDIFVESFPFGYKWEDGVRPGNNISGTSGDDLLWGTDGIDNIYGNGGNDWLTGNGGADRLYGGAGIDSAFYDDSTVGVTVNLATGRGYGGSAEGDTLYSIEYLYGSFHNDALTGDDISNDLYGLSGDDVLNGGGGVDGLAGDEGDDFLKGGGGADYLEGGAGVDNADYSTAEVAFYDWFGAWGVYVDLGANQAFWGEAAGDTFSGVENLTGSRYQDWLIGNDGHNWIRGMDGGDGLRGGLGTDTLEGGNGPDMFIWVSTDETGVTAATADTIRDFDFAQGDRIDLHSVDANVYAAGDQAFAFIGTAAFSGTPGEINYYHAGGDTYIQMQTGTGVDVEGLIRLAGIHAPDASWFSL
jgi:Ca2+-binding RTX toxin-like protein